MCWYGVPESHEISREVVDAWAVYCVEPLAVHRPSNKQMFVSSGQATQLALQAYWYALIMSGRRVLVPLYGNFCRYGPNWFLCIYQRSRGGPFLKALSHFPEKGFLSFYGIGIKLFIAGLFTALPLGFMLRKR